MLPRFFVPGAHVTEKVIELPDDEAAHLRRVLRLTPGDAVRVFNGTGREWHGTVDQVSKQRATVRLEREIAPLPEASVSIVLAAAVLKGEKMDDVVRDAVMLGVTAIQPLLTERTELPAAAIERSGRVARWQRIAASSAKQCGRAVVPTVSAARPFLELGKGALDTSRVMLAEPQVGAAARSLRDLRRSTALTLLVGPEGGWSAAEVEHGLGTGAMLVTLGHAVLRADAVPIVALTAIRVALDDF